MNQGWKRRKAFAEYADVGERTVAKWLKMGLPSAKIGGTRLIHVDQADAWLEGFMVKDSGNVDAIVNDILESL